MKKLQYTDKLVFVTKAVSEFTPAKTAEVPEPVTQVTERLTFVGLEDEKGNAPTLEAKRGKEDKTPYKRGQLYAVTVSISVWKESMYATTVSAKPIEEDATPAAKSKG